MKTHARLPFLKKTIPFRKDPTGRLHFVYPQSLGSAVQRFEAFQNWTVRRGLQALDPSSLVLCCLIAYDGLVATRDLCAGYEACATAGKWNDAVRIDWLGDGRVNARNLGCFTVLALQRVQKWEPFDAAVKGLEEKLGLELPTYGPNSEVSVLEALRSDAAAWLQHVLPPVFFGHVSGVAPMTALARPVLAREQKRLALLVEKPDLPAVGAAVSYAYEYAFEAAMLGKPAAARDAGAFIKKLMFALTPPNKGSDASKRKAVVDALGLLSVALAQVDEVCALLYLFALNLAVSGTRRKSVLAPDTPHSYIQSFALLLHNEVDGSCLRHMAVEKYEKVFRALLDPAQTVASYRVAGLKAFHLFLRSWWSVPELPREVFKIDTSTPVAANVIWPHEHELIDQWFTEATSTRFVRQLRAAILITRSAMIRIEELMKLRLLNLIDEGTQLCIEIAREISDGKEKTISGHRRVYVTDAQAMKEIQAWHAQRVQENATPDSYLFGDPSNPRNIANEGKMYYWMNRLLKDVTGDETVSVHTCRHSIASFRFSDIALSSDEQEVNPMDLLATDAGQAGSHVTTTHYCHLFEKGLRFALDKALGCLDLDYCVTNAWTGMPEARLRKRVSRLKAPSERATVCWAALQQVSAGTMTLEVSGQCQLETPDNPMLQWRQKPLSFQQITGLLSDIASGLSTAQACLRQDVEQSIVDCAMKAVGAFADVHGAPELEMVDRFTLGLRALKDDSGTLLGLLPDFSRMKQPRWELLTQGIQKVDLPVLSEAVDYWQRALSGRYLTVRPGSGFEKLLELIKTAQISTSLMEIRWSGTSDQIAEALALAKERVKSVLGLTIRDRQVAQRAGRPALWLVIGSDQESLEINGSANSMSGLHCALLSAHVWLAVKTSLENK